MNFRIRESTAFILFMLGSTALFGFIYSFFDNEVPVESGIVWLVVGGLLYVAAYYCWPKN